MKVLNTPLKAFMNKVKVSERAVLQRLNRALQPSGRLVKRCKVSSRYYGELGDFYAIDTGTNAVHTKHLDLATWAAEMMVLKVFEELDAVSGAVAFGVSKEDWAASIAVPMAHRFLSSWDRLRRVERRLAKLTNAPAESLMFS